MKVYSWKNTQYSQFNESDTLLLVSGVHFGNHSNTGEIAVFNLEVENLSIFMKTFHFKVICFLNSPGELRHTMPDVKQTV